MNKLLLFYLILLTTCSLTAQGPADRYIAINTEFIGNDSVRLYWQESESYDPPYYIFKKNISSISDAQLVSVQNETEFRDHIWKSDTHEYHVYQSSPFPYRDTFLLEAGAYTCSVADEFSKGLCCNFGNGYFSLATSTEELIRFDDFGTEASDSFELLEDQLIYLTVLPDLFGDHFSYNVTRTIDGVIFSQFGPGGGYIKPPPSYGNIWFSNDRQILDSLGIMIVLVEEDLADGLVNELDSLVSDLEDIGYHTRLEKISQEMTDVEVMDSLMLWYGDDNLVERTLLIIGHIAVPYSGDIFPDAHPENHHGAWPADGFYGVLTSTWTDETVNRTSAFFDRNKNIPGDGKWDQSTFPDVVRARIGRVDFSDMDDFEKTELELTRDYLNKVSLWRRGGIVAGQKGLMDDNFDDQFGAPAANGYRNISNLIGGENVLDVDFSTGLNQNSFLWTYSCGSGTHQSAAGVSSTEAIAEDSLQTIFMMSFGSQFGDWDNPNNFLRAPLASGTVLTNMWVGNPHIDFREMAVGFPIGASVKRTMNRPSALHEKGPSMVHIGLMGDPTLTMYPIAPPSDLIIAQNIDVVNLSWNESDHEDIVLYNIYRSDDSEETWTRLNSNMSNELTYTDESPLSGINKYRVIAIARVFSNGGSFFKRSLSIRNSIDFDPTLSISDIAKEQWLVYPNPANEQITIQFEKPLNAPGRLQDITGKIISAKSEIQGTRVIINCSDLPNGIYYYRVKNRLSQALIVQH